MSRCIPWKLALLAAGWAAAAGPAADQKGKAADTPERAVKYFAEAAREGDLDAVADQLTRTSRSLLKAFIETQKVQERFQNLIEKQFGKEPQDRKPPSMKEVLMGIRDVRVISKKEDGKNKVKLTVWETDRSPGGGRDRDTINEHTWVAVKEGGAWKLDLPFNATRARPATRKGPDGKDVRVLEHPGENEPDAKQVDYIKKMQREYGKAMDQLSRKIKDGKYKNRSEVYQAFGEAMRKLRKDNPPPGDDK